MRADNADRRLTPKGEAIGVIGKCRRRAFAIKRAALEAAERRLSELCLSPTAARGFGLEVKLDGDRARTGWSCCVCRMSASRGSPPSGRISRVFGRTWSSSSRSRPATPAIWRARRPTSLTLRAEEAFELPRDLDLDAVAGLSSEIRLRLAEVRPPTLGAAARLPGMTPAALTILYRYARKAA